MKGATTATALFLAACCCSYSEVNVIGLTPMGLIRRAEVNFAKFAEGYSTQEMDEWCWAASISNIFAYYGHPVAQERIVAAVWGRVDDIPAMAAAQIASQVNRVWEDDNGHRFRAHLTAAYDFRAGVFAINNAYIIGQLANDKPLLFCNTQHCMVLTAVDYNQMMAVVAGGVFDPWPGAGAHSLSPPELYPANAGGQMTFLAAITVSDIDDD